MARDVVIALLCLVALAVLLAGAADVGLWLDGRETVTQWLRKNPEWYFIPLVVVAAFFAALGIHLWL